SKSKEHTRELLGITSKIFEPGPEGGRKEGGCDKSIKNRRNDSENRANLLSEDDDYGGWTDTSI
ncbi:hypothetical protein DXG01_007801, partial [Tephrocybe rancida]